MAIDSKNYDHRGGGNYGIVLRLPQIVSDDRLVYFDYNKKRTSWVIRDFIAGQKLDDDHSALTVAQIEADATYDEFPSWCNAERHPVDWRLYLTNRTTAVFRTRNPPDRIAGPPDVGPGRRSLDGYRQFAKGLPISRRRPYFPAAAQLPSL